VFCKPVFLRAGAFKGRGGAWSYSEIKNCPSGKWGLAVAKLVEHCAASRNVASSIPDGVIILPAALCLLGRLSL
jgi:hypothetical protein